MMVVELFCGTVLVGATVVLHALALDLIIRNVRRFEIVAVRRARSLWKALSIALVVLSVFCVHIAEIWLWALFFLAVQALPDFETALYFSTTSYTTVGFGDVTPAPAWHLLGSIEAANGIMLFGWSTAFIFEIISGIYRKENESLKN